MSVHDRVADELRRRVLTGRYAPGARLPALWRVADELDTTETVVVRVVAELRRAGLLRSVPGVGVWVVDTITDTAKMRLELEAVAAGAEPAPRPPDAGADAGESWRVPFPASWIRRLLDERDELASRCAAYEAATMSETR